MILLSFRNIPLQQVQRGSRERGGFPPPQICFKSMSTSCEAKCASFFWMRRLVSKMSADQLTSLLQAKLVCVSEGTRRDLTLLTCTLVVGSGVERKIRLSSYMWRKLKGKDSPSLALDGQEMTAPWNVDVIHGRGKAHTDQNEAYGRHCSNSCSTGTLLHFVCACTFVCVI